MLLESYIKVQQNTILANVVCLQAGLDSPKIDMAVHVGFCNLGKFDTCAFEHYNSL